MVLVFIALALPICTLRSNHRRSEFLEKDPICISTEAFSENEANLMNELVVSSYNLSL